MVNQAALTYLKTYSKDYSLDSLKNKLISAGYTKEDVEEAASALGHPAKPVQTQPVQPIQQVQPKKPEIQKPVATSTGEKKGFNWMKFGGICGFIILIYLIEFIATSFFIDSIQQSLGGIFNIFMWVFSGITLLCVFFFYGGFYSLGKRTYSKSVKFASMSMIIVLLVLIIIGVGGFAGVNYQAGSSSITGEVIGEDFLISEDGVLSGGDVDMSPFVILLISIIAIASAYLFIAQIIFSIGLIKLRGRVKLSQVSGIFNLIWTILNISIFIALVYIFINLVVNPAFVVDLMYLLSGRLWIYNSFEISFIVLFFFSVLFESISLLSSGRKSEFGEFKPVQAAQAAQAAQQARPVHAQHVAAKPVHHTTPTHHAQPAHTQHVAAKPVHHARTASVKTTHAAHAKPTHKKPVQHAKPRPVHRRAKPKPKPIVSKPKPKPRSKPKPKKTKTSKPKKAEKKSAKKKVAEKKLPKI